MQGSDESDIALSRDCVAALRDQGFALLRSALRLQEVELVREAFGSPSPGSTLHEELDDRGSGGLIWETVAEHPVVTAVLDEMLEEYEVYIHGRDPGLGAGGQGLHADRPPGRHHPVDGVTVLWMLDEFTVRNGATRVVPFSHRGAAAVPKGLAQPGIVHPDEVVLTGRPGDALLLDAHLWHSGRENTSGSRRRAVQMIATRSAVHPSR